MMREMLLLSNRMDKKCSKDNESVCDLHVSLSSIYFLLSPLFTGN